MLKTLVQKPLSKIACKAGCETTVCISLTKKCDL